METIKLISKLNAYLLKGNKFWIYTYISILIKNIVLLIIATEAKFENVALLSAFISIPNILIYLCFPAAILSFAFLFNRRVQFWFLITVNLFISILFIIDLWNFRAFGDFISLHALNESANLHNLQDSIISMIRIYDIIFLLDIPIFIFKAIKGSNFYSENKKSFSSFAILLIIPILFIEMVHYGLDIKHFEKSHQLFQTCWSPNQTISNLSPLGYHFYDSYEYWKETEPQTLSVQDSEDIKSYLTKKKENLPKNKYSALFKGKNLILLQVESLEGFVINKKVNGQEITPNLNKLLKNSLYFTNFYEQVHNGTTSDAELMANTSVFPVRRGSTFFRYPNNTYNSLPKLFQNIGYSTVAIHPDKGAYWNWMKALTSFGFEKCIDETYFKQDEVIGLGISDETYFRQIEPFFKGIKQPFYTFMITLTSHGPFDLPKKHRELHLDASLDNTKLGGYFQSVHYTDKQIGMFLSNLKKDKLLDNTVIVIYGDHEGIHKFYQSEISDIKPSESWWLKNNKHDPLIIYQDKMKGAEIKTTGGEIDILPTLSYLMGIDKKNYVGTAIGRNLLNTKKDFVVLDNRKYIGKSVSKLSEDEAIKAISISDKIISSNYFEHIK